MAFTQIPSEVLEIVLSFSDANSIISLSSGCKQLRADCLNTDSVWSRLCEFDWATSDRNIIYKWTGSSEEDLMVVEEEPQSISPRFFDLYKQMHLTFRQYKPIFHSVASKWLRIEAVFKKQTNSLGEIHGEGASEATLNDINSLLQTDDVFHQYSSFELPEALRLSLRIHDDNWSRALSPHSDDISTLQFFTPLTAMDIRRHVQSTISAKRRAMQQKPGQELKSPIDRLIPLAQTARFHDTCYLLLDKVDNSIVIPTARWESFIKVANSWTDYLELCAVEFETGSRRISKSGNVDPFLEPAGGAVTKGIRVQATSLFMPQHSLPEANKYYFSYRIRIINEGGRTAQLLSRRWIITDGNGRVEEVRGPGVVGETPVLEPKKSGEPEVDYLDELDELDPNGIVQKRHFFEYTSACPLPTPKGKQGGSFQFIWSDSGEKFDVIVDEYTHSVPGEIIFLPAE